MIAKLLVRDLHNVCKFYGTYVTLESMIWAIMIPRVLSEGTGGYNLHFTAGGDTQQPKNRTWYHPTTTGRKDHTLKALDLTLSGRLATTVESNSEKAASVFLRWAGSKRQLLPALRKYFPIDATRYIEPFAGSACLFFSIAPQKAILADINAELIATYRAVKRSPDEVTAHLKGLRRSKTEYLRMRSLRPKSLTQPERAARFIYINRFCFNGLYRTNRKGEFNVPYGASGTGHLPDAQALRNCSRALRYVTLLNCDFEDVLKRTAKGDFVYMDPPYAVDTRRVFNDYHKASFSAKDVSRVRRSMEVLHRKGISFVVSYAESPEAEMLREGFSFETVSVRRNIAGFTSKRKYSNEILISNK